MGFERPARALALILPAFHLSLCVAIGTGLLRFEGSWGGFLIFLIDLPFSILLLPLFAVADNVLVLAIFGTGWWYLVSRFILYLSGRLIRRHRTRSGTS
jgi:hypothetical protein